MTERVVIREGGRIFIPKRLQEHLGMRDGDLVRLEEVDGALRLILEEQAGGLIEKDGLLVKPADADTDPISLGEIEALLDDMRDPDIRSGYRPDDRERDL